MLRFTLYFCRVFTSQYTATVVVICYQIIKIGLKIELNNICDVEYRHKKSIKKTSSICYWVTLGEFASTTKQTGEYSRFSSIQFIHLQQQSLQGALFCEINALQEQYSGATVGFGRCGNPMMGTVWREKSLENKPQ